MSFGRASLHPTHGLRASSSATAPLGFADGQLEALKWIALASMFIDHFGRLLLGHGTDTWIFAAGRLAFPLFALVLAVNLARTGDREARARRTAARLAGWCVVAVLPSIWARGDPQVVNVLGTLALGAVACWSIEGRAPPLLRLAAGLAAVALGGFCEFGSGGVALVAALYLACVHRHPVTLLVAVALLLATARLNAGIGGWLGWPGTLASVPVALAVRALPLRMPRWQLLFYALYPAHLALIGAWKWAG